MTLPSLPPAAMRYVTHYSLGAALLAMACIHGPIRVARASSEGHVGPVELVAVARYILETATNPSRPGYPSFLLAVSPLHKPSGAPRLTCNWEHGVLQSHGFEDDPTNWLIMPDMMRIEQVMLFDEKLAPHPATLDDIKSNGEAATYYVSYLCSTGNLAAVVLGYAPSIVAGWGKVLVLERTAEGWLVVSTKDAWIS